MSDKLRYQKHNKSKTISSCKERLRLLRNSATLLITAQVFNSCFPSHIISRNYFIIVLSLFYYGGTMQRRCICV